MSYRIVTDTCCDFPQNIYEELGLTVVALSVTIGGVEQTGISEADAKNLYEKLRKGESATTSAANPAQWAKAMEPILAAGEDVLVLAFSSGLSTTYQSAVIAAEELQEKYPERKIRVVDTLGASLGQGLFAYYTCKKRDEGLSLEELAAWCDENKQNVCHWFTVDDLMHLKRGGRVSAATALVGTMLQIKPVLHVDAEGRLVNVAKARGRKASIEALAKKVEELAPEGENEIMYISHGDCYEDAEYLAQILKSRFGVKEVLINYVGPVIGAHAGPGTLALFFLGKHR